MIGQLHNCGMSPAAVEPGVRDLQRCRPCLRRLGARAMSHRSRQLRSARCPESRAKAHSGSVIDDVVERAELEIYEPPRFFEAFLRGRQLHRGHRHHRTHLRDLPGRLSDQCLARDRAGLRRHARGRLARCVGCSTAANGSRATPCTSTFSMRPTFWATRTRSRSPLIIATCRARAGAEEGRQRRSRSSSVDGRSIRSTSGSAASTAARPRRISHRLPSSFAARSRRAGDGGVDRAASTSRT